MKDEIIRLWSSLLENINVGDLASIASLLLTIFVFFNVRKIKAYYSFTARIPELIDRLTEHTSKLNSYHQEFENSLQLIDEELAKSEASLEALQKKVDRPTRTLIKGILEKISKYKQTRRKNSDEFWKIYVEMSKVTAKVRDLQEERKWER